MMLKTRILKSDDCPKCRVYLSQLEKQKYQYEVYDGDAIENQKQLDEWKVNTFPVVQIIDDNGKVLYQFLPGNISPRVIEFKKAQLEKKR